MRTTDRPLRGIAYINIALMVLACNEALIRDLTDTYSPVQIAFIRFVIMALLVSIAILGLRRPKLFASRRFGLLTIRGILSAIATVAFFYSIEYLKLDDAVTVSLAAPIFVALLSRWFLGEQVTFKRWIAIVVGFAGVAVVMRPGAGLFNVWAFLALFSAATYAFGMMINRKLTETEDSLTILLYTTAIGGLVLLPFMFFIWKWTPYVDLPMLFLVGVLAGITQYLLIQAYRYAAANTIIAFDYIGVIYIAIVSYLVFAEVPSVNLMSGAVLLIASGMFIVYDETRQHRRLERELRQAKDSAESFGK